MTEEPLGLRKVRKMAEQADRLRLELKSKTAESAVRWEWADFTRYSVEPCYFELNKFRPGNPLEGEPDPPMSGATGHAFDCAGKLIAEIDQTEFPGQSYETYYVYERDGIASYYYDYCPTRDWISAGWMSLDGEGRIARIDRVYRRGNLITEQLEYDSKDRLIRVRRQDPNPPYSDLDYGREIEYDGQGRVSRTVWVMPDGSRKTDFERPAPGRTLESCKEGLFSALTETIIAALREAAPESPVYALALCYCDAEYEHRLPPNVSFATESDLERFRVEHPEELQYFAWYPAEWERHLSLLFDDELTGLCHSVNEDIWQNELYDEVDKLLADIAAALSISELPIPQSAMFTAYVTDLDNGDAVPDVRRFAPKSKQAILSENELL
jgi:hypothetical protein